MEIHIRTMQPEEAKEALAVYRKSFGFPEGYFSPKPKEAIVAVADGKIVGGLFYKTKVIAKKKLGYIDFLFTDPAHQGKGIARKLCAEGFKLMWEQGLQRPCDLCAGRQCGLLAAICEARLCANLLAKDD